MVINKDKTNNKAFIRSEQQPCGYCGAPKELELTTISTLTWAGTGKTDKETTVRCQRCQNVKFGIISPVIDLVDISSGQ